MILTEKSQQVAKATRAKSHWRRRRKPHGSLRGSTLNCIASIGPNLSTAQTLTRSTQQTVQLINIVKCSVIFSLHYRDIETIDKEERACRMMIWGEKYSCLRPLYDHVTGSYSYLTTYLPSLCTLSSVVNQRLTPPFLGHYRFWIGASCRPFCIDLETYVSDNFNSTVLTQF